MSLRIAPSSTHATSTTNTSNSKFSANQPLSKGAPSAPGLPDTLRTTSQPFNSTVTSSTHPLEHRLANWAANQEQLKLQMLRRTYGLGEPIRRGMELKMVRDVDAVRPLALGQASGVHEDILIGRDAEITWEDVYTGEETRMQRDGEERGGGAHTDMERSVGMWKW